MPLVNPTTAASHVGCRIYLTNSTAFTSGQQITGFTVSDNAAGIYASNQVTIPTTGAYLICITMFPTADTAVPQYKINGGSAIYGSEGGVTARAAATDTQYLTAGDIITFISTNTATYGGGAGNTYFSVRKI